MGKHSGDAAGPPWLLIVAAAVVVVVAAGFGVFRATSGSAGGDTSAGASASASATTTSHSATSTSSATTSTTSPATPTTSPADAAAQAAIQQCVARQQAAQPVVDAIATGAGHWRDHVQGQTDIDSGKRSLIDVKVNTWAPTKAAGPGDVQAYTSTSAAFASAPPCSAAAADAATGDAKAKLGACGQREEKLDALLAAGKAVIDDWSTHLTQMGQHAAGAVDSFHAQDNWLRAYAAAPAHLDPYAAARAAYDSAPACTA